MKQTLTHPPIIPDGYDKHDFNSWQKHLEKEREKFAPRYVEKKKLKKVA